MAYIMKMNQYTFDKFISNKENVNINKTLISEGESNNQIRISYTSDETNIGRYILALEGFYFDVNCDSYVNDDIKEILITLKGKKHKKTIDTINNENIKNAYNRCFSKLYYDFYKIVMKKTGYDSVQQFRSLLHLIMFLNLNEVFLVNSLEMFNVANLQLNKQDNDISFDDLNENNIKQEIYVLRKVELMGCFVKDENAIYICPEHIEHFLNQKDFDKSQIIDMYYKVFAHEVGHLVFSYLNYDLKDYDKFKCREKLERQANYFASYIYESYYDYLIKQVTNHQFKEYQNPLLLSFRYTHTPIVYDKEVSKLYKGGY